MRRPDRWGMASRIALAALIPAAIAIAILGSGVIVVGGSQFEQLMVAHGESVEAARTMFDAAVTRMVFASAIVAGSVSLIAALLLARGLNEPLRRIRDGVRRLGGGRGHISVPPNGPPEIAELARSFNEMADALLAEDRLRQEFIANAAHELRTPLTNIQGYLEALRDGVMTGDVQTYQSLWEEADRLVRLARSLDTLTQARKPDAIPLDLAGALRASVDLARPTLEGRELSVSLDCRPGLVVRADPDHLAQILANLLQNAARYTDAGGSVRLAADEDPHGVRIAISNSGATIPQHELPRLFERFYRLEKSRDRTTGGAGIGLSIVKQLVEAAGGRVGAESGDGVTSFWFSLPTA